MDTQDNITRIREGLRGGYYSNNPALCATDRALLSGEFAWVMSQLETILVRKPAIWNKIRKDVKSDTACERLYEQTPDGVDEMGLKLRAKSIEKMMVGLSGLLKLAESESKNLY